MGCALKRNEVTTPKLPPPPRTAQKRSGLSLAFAVTKRPLASTTSTDKRLSMVRPHWRVKWPMPPPSVSPPIPVVDKIPVGTARPNACAAWSTSPNTAPPPASTRPLLRVDANIIHSRQIDDERIVANAQPCETVAAAANGHDQVVLAAKIDRGDDVRHIAATGD